METITRDMVINDVIRKHPETIKVFNEHKVDSCCGGGAPIGTTAKRPSSTTPLAELPTMAPSEARSTSPSNASREARNPPASTTSSRLPAWSRPTIR